MSMDLAARRTGRAAAKAVTSSELGTWTLLIVAIAYWGNVLRMGGPDDATGLAFAFDAIIKHGAFCAAAWAMIAAAGHSALPSGHATRTQIALALVICLLSAIPTRQTTMIALVATACLLVRPAKTHAARASCALLLGLAAEMAWTSTYLMPLHDAVATLDAFAVQFLLRLAGIGVVAHGNIVEHANAAFSIEILSFCASSYPLANVGLAFMVTTIYQGRLPLRRDLSWAAASLVASVALTECRLAWMATGDADYRWLHDGGGVTLYALAAVALAAVFPLLATLQPRKLPAAA